ncbi:dynein axonemal assembly factor 11, partial [Cymbomonas tetramitiformis]
MPRITYELLQRRAEHNEGMVSTLEEVALHQEDIEKIECIGQHARHLKIIYMQNNLIMKFENLHRLKELEYLNVALNNITKVENLQRCESLTKLDLTVNFIDKAGMLSLPSLQANEFLKEIYLTGNPCADVEGYREFVVASIPQLKKLDGKDITHSERILAKQNLPAIQKRIEKELEIEGVDVDLAKRVEDAYNAPLDDDIDPNTVARPWSIETRIKDHREMRAERDKHEAQKKGNMDKLCGGDAKASKP